MQAAPCIQKVVLLHHSSVAGCANGRNDGIKMDLKPLEMSLEAKSSFSKKENCSGPLRGKKKKENQLLKIITKIQGKKKV